jgi:hypothetical protein
MPLDYSQRKLWAVKVHGFRATDILDQNAASTSVTIYLTSSADEKLPGPKIELDFAFPASHESTLQQLQTEALSCAAAVLQRVARETAETLEVAAKNPILGDEA